LEQSANNPDQSLALLDSIDDALATASAEDQAVLQAAALSAASNASGVATSILSNAGDVLNAMESGQQDAIIAVVSDAIADLSNLDNTATVLEDILPDPGTQAFDDFVAQASPEDLAMAAIVLLASEAQASGGVESYITQFPPTSPNTTETLAVELAVAAADSYAASGGTGQLADILAGLNLTTTP